MNSLVNVFFVYILYDIVYSCMVMYCLQLLVYFSVMVVIIFCSCNITTHMLMFISKVIYKPTGLGQIALL